MYVEVMRRALKTHLIANLSEQSSFMFIVSQLVSFMPICWFYNSPLPLLFQKLSSDQCVGDICQMSYTYIFMHCFSNMAPEAAFRRYLNSYRREKDGNE